MWHRPFELILFDLDGTLVDTAPEITDAVNACLTELGRPAVPLANVRGAIGHGAHHLWRCVLAEDEVRPAQLRKFTRRYLERCAGSRPYPHAKATLSVLQRRGVPMALVTNKEQRFVRPILEATGLAPFFALTVCGDTLRARKPDALPIHHCLDYLGIPPDRALLVGDSAIDVATARNAGIAVWAVSGGYGSAAELAAAKPDRIIPDLSALAEPAKAGGRSGASP